MVKDRMAASTVQPPVLKRVLLVDDNNVYAEALKEDLQSRGAQVIRAYTAREAVRILRDDGGRFDGVVTDISMESSISGLRVLREAGRGRFRGVVAVASTGLNTPLGFFLNRFILGILFGSDYLIPKKPIQLRKKVIWMKA